MPVFSAIELPFCTALRVDVWNAPSSRYFVAYRARGDYRSLLGHAVVDEFGTFSSPIFVTPAALLGKIYGFGISLGHRRDPEMGIDLGWPPLCAGIERPAPALPPDWRERLMAALEGASDHPGEAAVETRQVGDWELAFWRHGEVAVVGTTAPLLPRQLRRLCDLDSSALTIAFATGNRLHRGSDDEPTQRVLVAGELAMPVVGAAVRELVAGAG